MATSGALPRRIVKVRSLHRRRFYDQRLSCETWLFLATQDISRCLSQRSRVVGDRHRFLTTYSRNFYDWLILFHIRFPSQETQRLIAEPVAGISATPYEDNLRYFAVAIEGPPDSPYEKGIFQLELFLPADYPMAPPKVRFLTKIYHPNVDKLGRICLDILKDKWSPALQIRTVLLSIQALLSAPNPDDPLDNNVAEVWKKDEAEAIRRAREFTESFAMKSK